MSDNYADIAFSRMNFSTSHIFLVFPPLVLLGIRTALLVWQYIIILLEPLGNSRSPRCDTKYISVKIPSKVDPGIASRIHELFANGAGAVRSAVPSYEAKGKCFHKMKSSKIRRPYS